MRRAAKFYGPSILIVRSPKLCSWVTFFPRWGDPFSWTAGSLFYSFSLPIYLVHTRPACRNTRSVERNVGWVTIGLRIELAG